MPPDALGAVEPWRRKRLSSWEAAVAGVLQRLSLLKCCQLDDKASRYRWLTVL
jgi:hypothetical protein